MIKKHKTHLFVHGGRPGTYCGIPERDGIIFESGKRVTCKRCIKSNNKIK